MGKAQRAHHSVRKMMGTLRFAHPTSWFFYQWIFPDERYFAAHLATLE
jgi:hypothetical protein